MSNVKSALLVGVGGQGAILISKIMSNGFMQAGYDVKQSEVHGMAQRGGSVSTQVRWGGKVYGPVFGKGEADIMVALEKMEAVRYAEFLKPDGVAVINDYAIKSTTIASGAETYPQGCIEAMEKVFRTIAVPASEIALDLGNAKCMNVVLFGAMCDSLGCPQIDWEQVVADTVPEKVKVLTDEHGLNISQRNVTVSTSGIVPRMKELAKEHLQITLALSLHGSNQEKRRKLMPVANKYDITEVLAACDEYFKETGRRVSFEYSLVHGVNDTDEDAQELIHLLKHKNCHINLIPVNPVKERDFVRPSRKSALNFKNKLEKSGINVTIRREMGSDIDGACGQLRRRYVETEGE